MPTDTATQTVVVNAPQREVLALLRDVGRQPEWIPEIIDAEVLECTSDGRPVRARFGAAAPVGRDRYTLAYEHGPHSMSWTMVEGRLQTGQEGCYALESLPHKRTRVTYTLTIHHNLPLPGFVRRRVISGLVASTLDGLVNQMQ